MTETPGPAFTPVEDQIVTLRSLSLIPGDNTYLQGRTLDEPVGLAPETGPSPAPSWFMHQEGWENQFSLACLGAASAVNLWLDAPPPPADSSQPPALAGLTTEQDWDRTWVWTIIDDVDTDQPNAVLVISHDGRYLRGVPLGPSVDLVDAPDTTFHATSWQLGPVLVDGGQPPPPHIPM